MGFLNEVKVRKEIEVSGVLILFLKYIFEYKIKLHDIREVDFFNKNLGEVKAEKEGKRDEFLTLPKPVFPPYTEQVTHLLHVLFSYIQNAHFSPFSKINSFQYIFLHVLK